MSGEEIKIREFNKLLDWVVANNKIRLLHIQNFGDKMTLKVISEKDPDKIYIIEKIDKDLIECQNLKENKEYETDIYFDESKGNFVLKLKSLEEKENEYNPNKVKSLSDILNVIGSNTFKIKLEDVTEFEDGKIELDFMVLESQKHYALEVEEDRVVCEDCEDYDAGYYIANIKFDEVKGKYILYLTPTQKEEEEEEETEPFEIDKTSSIEENFEKFVDYVVDELNKRLEEDPEKIHYFTSVDYLKPFVEEFVNKIQTNWIYANLDKKLALKSFALYLAEQKGLNIERFKYLKEQYINIDIMLGIIILKQKILDRYINKYL